jgi:hypothetical protein
VTELTRSYRRWGTIVRGAANESSLHCDGCSSCRLDGDVGPYRPAQALVITEKTGAWHGAALRQAIHWHVKGDVIMAGQDMRWKHADRRYPPELDISKPSVA